MYNTSRDGKSYVQCKHIAAPFWGGGIKKRDQNHASETNF